MTVLVNHCCFRVQSECEANPGPRCFGSLYGAPEGAHTAPPHEITAGPVPASPDSLVHPSEGFEFEVFKWGLGAGFAMGLGASLIIFVALVMVFS